MRQNTRLAILAAELERQSPPESSNSQPPLESNHEGDSDGEPVHSVAVLPLRGGAPAKRETALRKELGIETSDPRTPNLRTPKMSRSGQDSVQATPSSVPRSAPEGRRECAVCGLQKSPRWRTGPDGPKTLCNRCGVYWATMRHKWDDLVARFQGGEDFGGRSRGTPATNGKDDEGGTGTSVNNFRKTGKLRPDPTPTPKNTRKRTTRPGPNPIPLPQANGASFLDSVTANGGVSTRSGEHAPGAARQLELATEEKSKPPKKRWIEELTETSPKRRSGQPVRWRALSDEGEGGALESPTEGGVGKRRRSQIDDLKASASDGGESGPDVRKEGRMQRGLARVLEAANGGPLGGELGAEVPEVPLKDKDPAPPKRRRTELEGLMDLVKKEEVPDRRGDGRLQRGLARVLEVERLANGVDDLESPVESGELSTRRRNGRRANGSVGKGDVIVGEDDVGGQPLEEEHDLALSRNRKGKPPLGKGGGGKWELRPRPDSGHRGKGAESESESDGEGGRVGGRKKSLRDSQESGLGNRLHGKKGEELTDGPVHRGNGIRGKKDSETLCMICEVRSRDALFSPCGHFNFCHSCAMQNLKEKGDCPKCGERVAAVQKVVL